MISFYPGPSRIHDEIPKYVADAARLGIMSLNHRSDEFVAISKKTISLLREKLHIPGSYTIFFTSSATECWEIIAQSLINDESIHVFSGSFGEKWFDYTHRLKPGASAIKFDPEKKLDIKNFDAQRGEVICITQNETSNGTQVSNATIRSLKKKNPGSLIAVDATSSMAGLNLDFNAADIWFASVQKCFGLPAGLGLMICSPEAIQKALAKNEKNHYNSITFMNSMMEKWQTPFTPNVIGIYLLMRVMEKAPDIAVTQTTLTSRYENWVSFLAKRKTIQHLIDNTQVHSTTVIPVKGTPEAVIKIKKLAKKKGFLLGEGYGELKATTFRIANFPALKLKEINALKKFLRAF